MNYTIGWNQIRQAKRRKLRRNVAWCGILVALFLGIIYSLPAQYDQEPCLSSHSVLETKVCQIPAIKNGAMYGRIHRHKTTKKDATAVAELELQRKLVENWEAGK